MSQGPPVLIITIMMASPCIMGSQSPSPTDSGLNVTCGFHQFYHCLHGFPSLMGSQSCWLRSQCHMWFPPVLSPSWWLPQSHGFPQSYWLRSQHQGSTPPPPPPPPSYYHSDHFLQFQGFPQSYWISSQCHGFPQPSPRGFSPIARVQQHKVKWKQLAETVKLRKVHRKRKSYPVN